jgi:hypothetical protein
MKFINLDANSAYDKAIKSCTKDTKLIVCGTEEDRGYIEEALQESQQSSNKSSKDIIKASTKINAKKWLTEQLEALKNEIDLNQVSGEWAGESNSKPGFTLASDIMTGAPLVGLVGAKVKTDKNWKIPAHFNFGSWNNCPSAEVHCAIWKYWQEEYGAKIVGVSNDVIEAHISKPPITQEEAIDLAWQHYAYCNDVVDQGTETVAMLASVLMNHDCWYFWWD